MARDINKILISTMPRSGTVYFFDFVAKLFNFKKIDPLFTGGLSVPPEWDSYKFDETYLSLKKGEVLCAHYPLTEKLLPITQSADLLCIYLYRDPRDVAVSAALYIKNALTHHPLHNFFQGLTESEAITFMITGGIINCDGEKNIIFEGMRYFCEMAREWLANEYVAAVRYEDLIPDPVSTLTSALGKVNVHIEEQAIKKVAEQLTFNGLSGGRVPGQEQKTSHFRKGVAGDYANYFSDTQKAVCKLMIGDFLIEQGYESNYYW